MNPIDAKSAALIVKNIVAACKDINKLNKRGYDFIYLASGFIAHYNLNGFIGYYSENSLKQDILDNAKWNQWSNFRPGEQNYEYYMSKKKIYNEIVAKIK